MTYDHDLVASSPYPDEAHTHFAGYYDPHEAHAHDFTPEGTWRCLFCDSDNVMRKPKKMGKSHVWVVVTYCARCGGTRNG
jgi:hypothetical protein